MCPEHRMWSLVATRTFKGSPAGTNSKLTPGHSEVSHLSGGLRGSLQQWASLSSWRLQATSQPAGPAAPPRAWETPHLGPGVSLAVNSIGGLQTFHECHLGSPHPPLFSLPLLNHGKGPGRQLGGRQTAAPGRRAGRPRGLLRRCPLPSLFHDQMDGQELGAMAAAILINQL